MGLFWKQEQSLTILSVILVIHVFVVIPFGERTLLEQVVFLLFYISLLATGMVLITTNKVIRTIAQIVLALLAISRTSSLFVSEPIEIANDLIIVFYCVFLIWVVLKRTFAAGPVTFHRIQGAIVVYLLVSFLFALLFHVLYLLDPGTAFKGLVSGDYREFLYFSLTTLTTVGYGDISPAIASVRSLANLESLIGQLYPAILIARLVSMEFEYSKKR